MSIAVAMAAVSWAHGAEASSADAISIGLGPGLYLEDTDQTRQTRRLGQAAPSDEQERQSDGLTNLNAWGLLPGPFSGLRWGGGLAWFRGYALQNSEDPEEDDRFEVGQVFQIYAQAEYTLEHVVAEVDALFGLRIGPTFAFAGGQLDQELQRLEGQGYNVWSAPRLGGFVAPHAGARWALSERLALRSDLSIQFAAMSLYDVEAQDSGITTEQSLRLSSIRTQLLLGLEFDL